MTYGFLNRVNIAKKVSFAIAIRNDSNDDRSFCCFFFLFRFLKLSVLRRADLCSWLKSIKELVHAASNF